LIKPSYKHPIDGKTYESTIKFFDQLLRLLHPVIPFITEELWQSIRIRENGESIMISEMPKPGKHDGIFLSDFEKVKEIISSIRTIRAEKNIAQKEELFLYIKGDEYQFIQQYETIIKNSHSCSFVIAKSSRAKTKIALANQKIGSFLSMVFILQNEQLLDCCSEFFCQKQCQLHRRRVITLFNGNNCLSRYAYHIC